MSITDDLFSRLQDGHIGRIGEQLGISQAQAQSAVAAALPLLVGALGRNAQQPQGASSLLEALGTDHAHVGVGNALQSALAGGGDGGSILNIIPVIIVYLLGQRYILSGMTSGAVKG